MRMILFASMTVLVLQSTRAQETREPERSDSALPFAVRARSSLSFLSGSRPANADSMLRATMWKPFDPSTLVAQSVIAAGLSVGVLIPSVAQLKKSEGLGEMFLLFATSVLAEAVIPLGVCFAGDVTGGNGTYGGTILCSLAGGAVGVLPAIISGRGSGEEVFPWAVIGAAAGSIVGYHLSASPVYEPVSPSPDQSGIPARNVRMTVVSIRF